MIAEDQEHVREALAMLLRGSGYSVLLCASPREALDVAAEQPFDLALVDMNYRRDSTSGVEGLNLIESLRQLDNTLPVAALTAWGNVDLAVNAMKSGASDFIEKPWRNDALLEKVGSLTRRGREVRSQRRISEYEKQDAQQVQMRIVPRRHIVAGGVEIFGESVPFGNVGGDYFGVWQPTPESLHFCVADVSGKGTSGALIAAMLHASVSTLAVADGGHDRPDRPALSQAAGPVDQRYVPVNEVGPPREQHGLARRHIGEGSHHSSSGRSNKSGVPAASGIANRVSSWSFAEVSNWRGFISVQSGGVAGVVC